MSQKDLYQVLGVSENATTDEIRKAYRRLAKEYHPDRNKGKEAEDRFKDINEAFSILSNADKRKKYDQIRKYGPQDFTASGQSWEEILQQFGFGGARANRNGQKGGFSSSGQGFDFSMDDIFSSFFGDQGSFGGSTGRSRGRQQHAQIVIPFETAVQGGQVQAQVDIPDANGRVSSTQTIPINIPPGIEDGTTLMIQTAPQQSAASAPIYVTVRVQEDSFFKRDGLDVHAEIPLNIAQAILGSKIRVRTPLKGRVVLKIPAGTQGGEIFRMKGMGLKSEGRTGDMYVKVRVEIPRDLDEETKELVKKIARHSGLKY